MGRTNIIKYTDKAKGKPKGKNNSSLTNKEETTGTIDLSDFYEEDQKNVGELQEVMSKEVRKRSLALKSPTKGTC